MNKYYVQQSTNPELQTQDSTQLFNLIEQWFKQQSEMEHSGEQGWYKSGSLVSPLLAYGAGDFSQNVLNYWTKEDKLGFSWSKVYSNGFKSIFKIDFFSGGSSIGFNTFNNIYNR